MPRPITIEHCLKQRLESIQRRHNFHPDWGARQIANVSDREVQGAYAVFAFITSTIDRCGLAIPIPYDPTGLAPTEHLHERVAAPEYVYFARLLDAPEWKIGRSHEPIERCRQLQTGNAARIEARYQVEGDLELENLVHSYLSGYRSRRGGGQEWFYRLDEAHIRDVIERIRREGRDFLMRARTEE